jgi:tricorn protease
MSRTTLRRFALLLAAGACAAAPASAQVDARMFRQPAVSADKIAFIELLNRPILAYWAVRDAPAQQWPPVAHRGPQVMLINGWSGSGGDAFPFYFREAGLGPLIGTRTWGGLIGISGVPSLVDGGTITVPTFRMFDPKGQWFAEGHGVDPDIPVEDDPARLARGTDPQLQRAIEEVTKRVAAQPKPPSQPPYEKRTPSGP